MGMAQHTVERIRSTMESIMIGNLFDLPYIMWLAPGMEVWHNFVDWFNQF